MNKSVIAAGAIALVAVTALVTMWMSRPAPPSMAPVLVPIASEAQPVYPAALQGTKSLELGELILLLMPDANTGEQFGWDYRVAAPITWATSGYEQGGGDAAWRRGDVRVNIRGAKSTRLRQKVEELGWSVSYETSGNPRFGPTEIEIHAGGDGPETCFGTLDTGCEFPPPLPSLTAAGISVTAICAKDKGDPLRAAFLLKHDGRKPTVMMWETSGGQGAAHPTSH